MNASGCARSFGGRLSYLPECDPLLRAPLAELDEPTLRSARERPQSEAGQLGIPVDELAICDSTPSDVAIKADMRAARLALPGARDTSRLSFQSPRRRYQMAIV
jgi:hypothetical protein